MQVNIHEAKTKLSALLQAVEKGEEVIIARAGKPVARLNAIENDVNELPQKRRRFAGALKGKIWMSDDFDAPLPDDFWHDPEEDEYYR